MAPRWVDETLLPSFDMAVVLEMDRSLVQLEDPELRSPGLSKPMRRAYEYVQTPEAAGMGNSMRQLAEKVHKDNLQAKGRAEEEFEQARNVILGQHAVRPVDSAPTHQPPRSDTPQADTNSVREP